MKSKIKLLNFNIFLNFNIWIIFNKIWLLFIFSINESLIIPNSAQIDPSKKPVVQ